MKAFLFLILLFSSRHLLSNSREIWQAHPQKDMPLEHMLQKNLSFILTQAQAAAGLEFISLREEEQRYVYELFSQHEEYKGRIGASHFRNFRAFSRRMNDFAHYIPDGSRSINASNEALARTAYYFYRMSKEMGVRFDRFEQVIGRMQRADYVTSSKRFHHLAMSLCTGDISPLGVMLDRVPVPIIDWVSDLFSGKSCQQAVREDLLEIVYPYNNPIKGVEDHGALEATSIHLSKLLLPNSNYRKNPIYRSLLQLDRVAWLNPRMDLFASVNQYTGLNAIDTIRLINLANHNHGLEYFSLTAILSYSHSEEQAVYDIMKTYQAFNNLYRIVHLHEKERKKFSNDELDHLDKRYHYWGGAFVACELMARDYPESFASFTSSQLGKLYEQSTSVIETSANSDIRLHKEGAKLAKSLCSKN